MVGNISKKLPKSSASCIKIKTSSYMIKCREKCANKKDDSLSTILKNSV